MLWPQVFVALPMQSRRESVLWNTQGDCVAVPDDANVSVRDPAIVRFVVHRVESNLQ